jgi:micrococcal nuclease
LLCYLQTVRTNHKHAVAPPGSYYVTYVYDGDTIEVDMDGTKEKVRLIGVDTPETHKPNTPVQCYGVKASDYSKKHLEHTTVRLESDEINQNRDRYGRLLRYVYDEGGVLWNKNLIETGYGRALTAFPFTKKAEFVAAETTAKNPPIGLWAECT